MTQTVLTLQCPVGRLEVAVPPHSIVRHGHRIVKYTTNCFDAPMSSSDDWRSLGRTIGGLV